MTVTGPVPAPGLSKLELVLVPEVGGPGVPVIGRFRPVPAVPSACTISANPFVLDKEKNTTTLTWGCTGDTGSCSIVDDNAAVPDIGSVAASGTAVTPPIAKTTTFTVGCTRVVPDADDSVTIEFVTRKEIRAE